jgi:hypothetical protein
MSYEQSIMEGAAYTFDLAQKYTLKNDIDGFDQDRIRES